jgi:iron complex outermembrane receptor protein
MNRSAARLTASLAALACAQFAAAASAAAPAEPAAAEAADAADAGPVDEPDPTGSFSEIIVSATKRDTDLQKTPIAISVVDPQMIEDRHIQSLLDLGDGAAPSLRVATFESRQSALTVGIRGIVPFDANQTARDQGVGVYIDGVYLGRQQGLNAALFDVQRIEVLRGPQGTLFGRNTEGGAVSIVTKEPSGEFGGRLVGGIGNFGGYSTEAHIDLPAFANIAIKVDGLIQHQDATTENPLEGQYGWNYYNRAGGRITAKWEPSSDFSATISFDKAKDENTPLLSQLINYNPNNRPVGTYVGTTLTCPAPATSCIAPLAPLVYVSGNQRQGESEIGVIQQPSVDRTQGVMGKLEYQLSDSILLRSITAYREVDAEQWDGAATAHRSAFAPNGNFGRYSLSHLWEHQFSQELQVIGSMPQVDWVIGGFYFDERAQEEAATPNPLKWNADGTGYTINSATRPNPNLPASSSNQGWATDADWFKQRGSYADTKSLAVFGQATFTPAGFDVLHLTAGGRYTHDTREGVLYVVSGVPTNWTLDYSDNRFDPMVTLAFDVSPDVNVYAKYSSGYRAGGANTRSSNFSPFGPESVKAYEVGAKMSLLDDRLRINLAGYLMDRKGTQIDFDNVDTVQFLPGTTIPNPTYNLHTENTANAPGTSKIKGFEAEVSAKPIRELTIGASYAYTDSEIPATDNPNTPLVVDPTQVFVVYTPKHAVSGFLDFDTEVADNGMGLRLHLDANYAGRQYSFQSENVLTESSFIVNGRLALTSIPLTEAGTELTLALWSRNLLNEDHIYRRSNANNNTIGAYGNFNPPRTFGAEATVNF